MILACYWGTGIDMVYVALSNILYVARGFQLITIKKDYLIKLLQQELHEQLNSNLSINMTIQPSKRFQVNFKPTLLKAVFAKST